MNLRKLLDDKTLRGKEKTKKLVEVVVNGNLTFHEIEKELDASDETQITIMLQAVEEITNKRLKKLDVAYLALAQKYLLSNNNAIKREASRIVGNLAQDYPDKLDKAIKFLLQNVGDDSTVVRWGSAYALAKIVVLDQYANSDLHDKLDKISERETDQGVKNQYVKALQKAVSKHP